jgi:hypothetical protein
VLCGASAVSCSSGTQEIARTHDPAGSGNDGSGGGGSPDDFSNPTVKHDAAVLPGDADISGADGDAGIGTGCARAQYSAKLKPLDMFILLDQSGSMTEDDDRWTPTTKALKKFVAESQVAGMGVALQYFPLGPDDDVKCEADTYAKPAVEMQPLPGNAQPIIDSIDAHYFTKDNCCDAPEHDGTPTRPAMEGVAAYMRAWVTAHSDRAGVILLATDGEPSPVCDDNGIDEVSEVIADASKGDPAIPTYVIGIGHEDKLEELAEAGDTGLSALIVDGTGVDTESDLLDALGEIRGEALPCDFELPQGEDVDPLKVNIQRSIGSAAAVNLVHVQAKADCKAVDRPAWYYDDRDDPTRVILCPKTCDEVVSDPSSSIQIVLGCATVGPI